MTGSTESPWSPVLSGRLAPLLWTGCCTYPPDIGSFPVVHQEMRCSRMALSSLMFRLTKPMAGLLILLLGGVIGESSTVVAQPRDVRAGVYSKAQAERGEQAYAVSCGSCLGMTLAGGEGPALAGEAFIIGWKDTPLSDLFTVVKETMPRTAPGSLSPEINADIVAFILKANGFPPGETDLSSDAEALAKIPVVG